MEYSGKTTGCNFIKQVDKKSHYPPGVATSDVNTVTTRTSLSYLVHLNHNTDHEPFIVGIEKQREGIGQSTR